MKKILLTTVIALGMILMVMPMQTANAVDFAVSAYIPKANAVTITATEVDAASGDFGNTVTDMDFDPMTYDSAAGIWLPDHYFAVDVGVTSDGVGSTDVIVTYSETTSDRPAGQIKGLGYKSTATFVTVTGSPGSQTETDLAGHGPTKLLKDVSGENIFGTELGGGFFRMYVGLYPGGDGTLDGDGGEPFTNSDKTGDYTGTLTVTAVVS